VRRFVNSHAVAGKFGQQVHLSRSRLSTTIKELAS
jgi:hypothetical protein